MWSYYVLYAMYVLATNWMEFLPKSYVEALSPNVTVFGYSALKEGIKLKWGHKGGDLTQYF